MYTGHMMQQRHMLPRVHHRRRERVSNIPILRFECVESPMIGRSIIQRPFPNVLQRASATITNKNTEIISIPHV